jgi:protein TonB
VTPLPRERASVPAVAASIAIHAALLAVVLAPFARTAVAPVPRSVEVRLLATALPARAAAPAQPGPPPRARPTPRLPPPKTPAPARFDPPALPAPAAPATAPTVVLAAARPAPEAPQVAAARAAAVQASAIEPLAAPASAQDVRAAPAAPPSLSPPSLLDHALPEYPWMSRRLRESGRVLLDIVVGTDGRAQAVSVAQTSGHPRLDDAAAAAARGWRFEPAREGDRPVVASVRVPVVFDLDRGGGVGAALVAAHS